MNPLEKYLAAMELFNQSVAELTAKFEQANEARDQALMASAELRRELEITDQRVQDITIAFRQQISADFAAKRPAREESFAVASSRAS